MADGDLLDAREAMQMLGINENELQTLVARGDLRAFRAAGTMKFRRDDVMSIKADKGTEPTIIIPAAAQRKGASGILPTVPAAARPPSRLGQAIAAPQPVASAPDTATSDIVLDDIELMPTDDQHITQQVTVAQAAVSADIGGATVLEPSPAATGDMTVVETGPDAQTGPAPAVTASGRRRAVTAPPAAATSPAGSGPHVAPPAMSRVRPAVQPGVSVATSKRTQAVYQPKPAGAAWTAITVLTSLVMAVAASILAVMMTCGSYDSKSSQRVIPPFLSSSSQLKFYEWYYGNTPGDPQDTDRPKSEYPFTK